MSAFDLLLCLVGDLFFIKLISRYHERVMHIFLEIPRKYALFLNSECESYIADLQNAENKNEADDPSEDDEKDEDDQTVSLRYDRGGYQRIYTHRKSMGNHYLISFVFLMLATEAYFVWQFVVRSEFYGNISDFSKIYRTAYEDMVTFMEVLDIYREYFTNPSTTYGRNARLVSVVETYWDTLYDAEKVYKTVLPVA